MNFCSLDGSCKTSNKIYGVINRHTNRLHKLSFSKSLIDLILTYDNTYSFATFRYTLGDKILPGQESKSGLYGIMSTNKDRLLRIQLDKETAT